MLDKIEQRWQKRWADAKAFEANPSGKKKYFLTFPFAYLNGPLHLGHGYTCARVDITARFKRMQGYNVLFPFAWHVTGEPIAGVAERLKKGDETQRKVLLDSGVPENEIERFHDPEHIIKYYKKLGKLAANRIGFSVDWRREFTTTPLTPTFSRFIEWQYNTLKAKGYVRKGTHPVIWCPHCESPTGDHDRLEGEGVAAVEFTLLKFDMDDGTLLIAATLRPETIYGVTNFWIKPDVDYVEAQVDGERWVISKIAAEKLPDQGKEVKVLKTFKGEKLIGRTCRNRVNDTKVLILPADFVDPANTTGDVMSVPAHAPFDYIALEDLKKDPGMLNRYSLKKEDVERVGCISLISIDKYGEFPAIDVCKQLQVKDQHDPNCEKATKIVYKEEFHTGTLKANTGKYAGLKVSEVKDVLIKDFLKEGIADAMWETADPVICRCGTRCDVKILENQWFLAYSDEKWKGQTRKALKEMTILPDEGRAAFEYTIGWLQDKACARKGGLGTPIPWDNEWKVETLSDSTVYMAYYTIAKHINALRIKADQLTDEVLDYVFLGKGSPEALGKKVGLKPKVLKEMHEEFEYWYPMDFRNSAKELIYNHLTFCIFQHLAIWPAKYSPRAFGVNGMINVEGQKMSKSKGNFILLLDALKGFGADPTRMGLVNTVEGLADPDWHANQVQAIRKMLEKLIQMAKEARKAKGKSDMDAWLNSKMQMHISKATEHYERVEIRSALMHAFFGPMNDLRWYLKRGGRGEAYREAVLTIAKLAAPVVPHVAEEVWEILGGKGFIAFADWPEAGKRSEGVEKQEDLVADICRDIDDIISFKKLKPKKIYLYTCDPWKYKVYNTVLKANDRSPKVLMPELMKDANVRAHGKDAPKLLQKFITVKDDVLKPDEEFKTLAGAKGFLGKNFGCKAEVYKGSMADYDPLDKAKNANPGKPAIYLE